MTATSNSNNPHVGICKSKFFSVFQNLYEFKTNATCDVYWMFLLLKFNCRDSNMAFTGVDIDVRSIIDIRQEN